MIEFARKANLRFPYPLAATHLTMLAFVPHKILFAKDKLHFYKNHATTRFARAEADGIRKSFIVCDKFYITDLQHQIPYSKGSKGKK